MGIVDVHWPFFLYWMSYLLLTMLGVMNMIVGILCETVSASATLSDDAVFEKEVEYKNMVLRVLTDVFKSIDTNGEGKLYKEEFYTALETNPTVQEGMMLLGLGDEENLFERLDGDESGDVSIKEWYEGIQLIMHGNRPTQQKDLIATHLGTNAICKIIRELEDGEAELQLLLMDTAEAILSLKPEHFKDEDDVGLRIWGS